jgi:hypothetical protein
VELEDSHPRNCDIVRLNIENRKRVRRLKNGPQSRLTTYCHRFGNDYRLWDYKATLADLNETTG